MYPVWALVTKIVNNKISNLFRKKVYILIQIESTNNILLLKNEN
jgi:hypothetical protein